MKRKFTVIIFFILALGGTWLALRDDHDSITEGVKNEVKAPLKTQSERLRERRYKRRSRLSQSLPKTKAQTSPENAAPLDEEVNQEEEEELDFYRTPRNTLVAINIDDRWITQGDLLVREGDTFDVEGTDASVKVTTLKTPKIWENGVVPYLIEPTLNSEKIEAAINDYHILTRVRFKPRSNETDYVVFQAAEGQSCYSHLGKVGGAQEIVVGSSCLKGQIIHEIMHTLGFVHEQSRVDRDEYITIHWENIQRYYRNQFQKLPANISLPIESPFDFNSILMYPANAFSSNKSYTITKSDGTLYKTNRLTLSKWDVHRINELYQNPSTDF